MLVPAVPTLELVSRAPARFAVRRPSRRSLACAGAVVALVGAAYAGARESSLLSVRRVEIGGAAPEVAAAARAVLARTLGESLVAVDGRDLERRLAAVPAIRSAAVDRAFPDTIRVAIRPERPVAVFRRGTEAWLLSARGRVIARTEPGLLRRLPRVWLRSGAPAPSPGGFVAAGDAASALRALARLPFDFPLRVATARAFDGVATLTTAGGTEIRLGELAQLRAKLGVAARVLRALPPGDRRALAYLDVSVPARPVARLKSQVTT